MSMRWKQITESPVYANNFPWTMPLAIRDTIMSWPVKTKSPYSHSYYDVSEGEKTWDNTPLDSLRVSDHWNFTSPRTGRKINCPTDRPVQNRTWCVGKWDGEKYIISDEIPFRKITQLTDNEAKRLPPHQRQQRQKGLDKYARREREKDQ